MGNFDSVGSIEEIKNKAYNMAIDHAISITKTHRNLMAAIPGTEMIVQNIDVLLHQFELIKQPVKKTIMDIKKEGGEHLLDEDYNNELTVEHDPDLHAPSMYDEEQTEP